MTFHGATSIYSSNYSQEALKWWIDALKSKIKKQKCKVEKIYVYFNNGYNAYAVNNARTLKDLIKE